MQNTSKTITLLKLLEKADVEYSSPGSPKKPTTTTSKQTHTGVSALDILPMAQC